MNKLKILFYKNRKSEQEKNYTLDSHKNTSTVKIRQSKNTTTYEKRKKCILIFLKYIQKDSVSIFSSHMILVLLHAMLSQQLIINHCEFFKTSAYIQSHYEKFALTRNFIVKLDKRSIAIWPAIEYKKSFLDFNL